MKKLITIILILALLLPAAAMAENPLAEYSLEQLHLMRQYICQEILSRSEWSEVTVKPGYYVVGEDIPAGHWTVTYSQGEVGILEYFKEADETGIKPADDLYDCKAFLVGDPNHSLASIYNVTEFDITLDDGYHVNISMGPVVFKPFAGRQSPFFD